MIIATSARISALVVVSLCSFLLAEPASQPGTAPAQATGTEHLPITEVTVFKDGHAFVLHEGSVPVDEAGQAVLDDLPAPVLGTFWPYAAQRDVILQRVVAGRKNVRSERPAMGIRDLLEANKGGLAHIYETDGRDDEATILDVPQPKPEPVRTPGPAGTPQPSTPEQGRIVLLKTHEQTKAVNIDRIREISFRQEPTTCVPTEESRGLLTLHLSSLNSHEELRSARVGMVYLQKGLRWIPTYKVEIDGKGTATVKLQATLINELADLKNTRLQLVVGVPTFAFKDSLDPMSLQETAAQLGQHFRPQSQTAFAFSNAIMSQTAFYEPQQSPSPPPAGPGLGPDLPEGTKSEDLFIFTVENISLAKGERMVVPVAEYTVPYKDVYVLEIPLAPPVEVIRSREGNPQEMQNARLMAGPKVMHKLRLTNNTGQPFTTAPALIVRDGRALGQGMMMYTAVNGTSDLDLTVAVEVRAKKSDVETERVPNALNWNNVSLARINLAGTISLTNNRDHPIDLEVVRHVLGHVDAAEQDGKAEQTHSQEDAWEFTAPPQWFGWYSWPWWWNHVNGIGRIRWDLHLEPGKTVELKYTWHYFWG